MSKRLIMLDDLVCICGHYNPDTNVNNGYGCNHPNQEQTDIDKETGKEQGKCYGFSCPIAYTADLEDMRKLDPDLAEEYKNDADENGEIESDWLVYDGDEK